ncbi:MAG: hypothetical protein LBC58_05540 [Clostridiales Family XIII bacterium]|jgi:hypothetical protein|nr:hypothetical protein [Clostridiales Family XIII bacterium]
MPRFLTENKEILKSAVDSHLADYVGETVSAVQIWYEGLGGFGKPEPWDTEAITEVLNASDEWEDIGSVRHEKFGAQPSYRKKAKYRDDPDEPLRIQHKFKLNALYKAPDGRVLKAVCCEVYNLRLFEIKDGHMTGPMIKIHPRSELADSLVEVVQ